MVCWWRVSVTKVKDCCQIWVWPQCYLRVVNNWWQIGNFWKGNPQYFLGIFCKKFSTTLWSILWIDNCCWSKGCNAETRMSGYLGYRTFVRQGLAKILSLELSPNLIYFKSIGQFLQWSIMCQGQQKLGRSIQYYLEGSW